MSYKNLVKQAVTGTPGTGTVTLASAVTGFLSVSGAGLQTGDKITYQIEDAPKFETGRGTLTNTSGTWTMTRDQVFESSAGYGVKESFTSAAVVAQVFLAQDANRLVDYTRLAWLYLKMAASAGALLTAMDTVADSFLDQTGVDAAASSGEVYDSTNKLYRGVITAGAYPNNTDFPAMTAMTTNGPDGATTGNYVASGFHANPTTLFRLWDKNASTETSGGGSTGDFELPTHWQITFPSTRKITGYSMTKPTNSYGSLPRNWTFEGSNNGTTWTTLHTVSNATWATFGNPETKNLVCTTSAQYLHYRFVITALVSDPDHATLAEIGFTFDPGTYVNGTTGAVTLISNAMPAMGTPAPTRGYLMVVAKSGGKTIVPGSDIVAKVSRDGGSNWLTVALTEIGTLPDGSKVYETVEGFDFTTIATGTSMKWRLELAAGNDTTDVISICDVVFNWGR